MTKTTVIQEAAMLKEVLLPVQRQLEKTLQQTQPGLLESVVTKINTTKSDTSHETQLVDVRVVKREPVLTPGVLATALPISEQSATTTAESRTAIANILNHTDNRLVVIVGPCSIHDAEAAIEYAGHVKVWREKFGDNLEIVMRAYMEKPRSELGWKGLTYDPLLDESADLNVGLILTRLLTRRITDMGVPIAMERLNALTPQYVNGLVAYDAIGARNIADQKAREYASITSSPVGLKNPLDGDIDTVVQAIIAVRAPHAFMGMTMNGVPCSMTSTGNATAHVILRGSNSGPNYAANHVAAAKKKLASKGLPESIMVDASHGNSGKKAANQKMVIASIAEQLIGGEQAICGVMIESNLLEGSQKLVDAASLEYGKSITDECVGIEETERMLSSLAKAVHDRRKQ